MISEEKRNISCCMLLLLLRVDRRGELRQPAGSVT
jgi:hypothetical protein